jgi:hypothetical protein
VNVQVAALWHPHQKRVQIERVCAGSFEGTRGALLGGISRGTRCGLILRLPMRGRGPSESENESASGSKSAIHLKSFSCLEVS